MGDIVLIGGTAHAELARLVAGHLATPLSVVRAGRYANGEHAMELAESVRDGDVYILQSFTEAVNDDLMELLLMVHACKSASARRVTAVLPYFPYARHVGEPSRRPLRGPPSAHQAELIGRFTCDEASLAYRPWSLRCGPVIARMFEAAGADHIITVDLHDPQFAGFFNIPLDDLPMLPLVVRHLRQLIPDWQEAVIVSPDAGGAKRYVLRVLVVRKWSCAHAFERHHTPLTRRLQGNAHCQRDGH